MAPSFRLTPPTLPERLPDSKLPLVAPVIAPDLSTFVNKFPWHPTPANVPPDVTIQPIDPMNNNLAVHGPTLARPNHIQPAVSSNRLAAAINRWAANRQNSNQSYLSQRLSRKNQSGA